MDQEKRTDTADAPDEALVARCLAGDAAAFDVLVYRHQPGVYRLAWALLGDRDDAEDVVVETFLRAYRALPRFEAGRPMAPWLSTIAANLCRTRARRRREPVAPLEEAAESRLALPLWPSGDSLAPEDRILAREGREAVLEALRALPAGCREAAVLRFLHDLPRAEVARALGIPESTVVGRLARARRLLSRALGRYFGREERR